MLMRVIAAAAGTVVLALAGVGAAFALHENDGGDGLLVVCAAPGGPLKLAVDDGCGAATEGGPRTLTILGSDFGASLEEELLTIRQALAVLDQELEDKDEKITIHQGRIEDLERRVAALEAMTAER